MGIPNPKKSQVQNQSFLSADMMLQVENSTSDIMWFVAIKTQVH